MFALAVEYLTGRSVATAFDDRDATEWPPHPVRLFSALVDAWADGGKDSGEERALRWLEEQPSPSLTAGEADVRPPQTVYVPPNDARATHVEALPDRRRRQPRTFPSATPHSPRVEVVWPEAQPPEDVVAAIRSLVTRVPRLGHSSSFVCVRVLGDPGPPDLVPMEPGDRILRVPAVGQLDALEHAYHVYVESGIRGQLPCAFQAYGPPVADKRKPRSSVFGEMIVFRRSGRNPQLPIEAAPRVAALVRAATMRAAGPEAPEAITGHAPGGCKSERPHVAYVALPDVGHRHADGHLLGVAAVLPREVADAERAAVYRALLEVTFLNLGPAGRWNLERVGADPPSRGLIVSTWARPATRWATATPIELDAFPDSPFGEEARAIVGAACQRIGLPEPGNVVVVPDSVVPGCPPWHVFARRRPASNRPHRPLVHAVLEFVEPVAGPILLGAGRYQGLGLLRPLP